MNTYVARLLDMEKTASVNDSVFSKVESNPILLKVNMDKKFGQDWLGWLPETINTSVSPVRENLEKLLAIQSVIGNPLTQEDPDAFENCCTAFNNEIPIWGILEPLNEYQLCWGCMVIKALNPLFVADESVLTYCFACMEEDGLLWNPWLDISLRGNGLKDTTELASLENTLKSKWKIADSFNIESLKNVEFQEDNMLQMQLEKLVNIKMYIEAMLNG